MFRGSSHAGTTVEHYSSGSSRMHAQDTELVQHLVDE
jgi:hypothetical protein